jgi:hypothetical protein
MSDIAAKPVVRIRRRGKFSPSPMDMAARPMRRTSARQQIFGVLARAVLEACPPPQQANAAAWTLRVREG